MKVRLSKPWFVHGSLHRVGAEVELPQGTKPTKWMEPVADKMPTVAKPKAKEPETFSELNKAQAKAEADATKAKETGPKGK